MKQKKIGFSEITEAAAEVLPVDLARTKGTIKYYWVQWRKTERFMESSGIKSFDFGVGKNFLLTQFGEQARVQEITDLTPGCIMFDPPYTIRITGKGNKTRIVPLQEEQVGLLRKYIKANQLDKAQAHPYPLFFNSRKEKLTRAGVSYILLKYAELARRQNDRLVPPKISCHVVRHSKAMHLLQAGVNLVYIRDFLGHVSIQTTEIYARADSKQKRKALEKAYVEVKPDVNPYWLENKDLLGWLKSF